MLPPLRFHVRNEPDAPLVTQSRSIGKINSGLYCNRCDEFICFAAEDAKPAAQQRAIEFLADGPLLIECPYCMAREDRHVCEIRRMPITESNKKRRCLNPKR